MAADRLRDPGEVRAHEPSRPNVDALRLRLPMRSIAKELEHRQLAVLPQRDGAVRNPARAATAACRAVGQGAGVSAGLGRAGRARGTSDLNFILEQVFSVLEQSMAAQTVTSGNFALPAAAAAAKKGRA